MTRFVLSNFRRTFNEPPAVPPVPPVSPPPPPPPPAAKTFTQDEVNAMMAENKRTLQQKNAELITQLEEAKKSAGLTAEQKEELESRIETLSKEHLSKEQQAAEDLKKLQKKSENDLKFATEESAKYKGLYENTLIEHAMIAAAVKHKAHNPEQMLRMFRSDCKVVPVLDDAGKPTGAVKVVMPVKGTDAKTNQPVVLELSLDEAVGKIREDETFANMFTDTSIGGLGDMGNPKRGGGSGSDAPPTDPVAYRAWRKKQGLA